MMEGRDSLSWMRDGLYYKASDFVFSEPFVDTCDMRSVGVVWAFEDVLSSAFLQMM